MSTAPTTDRDDDRGSPGLLTGPVRVGLLVLLAYAALGAVAGGVWEWVWTPPGQVVVQHHVLYDSYSSLRRVFSGTGLYVLVAAVASALLALVVTVLVRGRELLVLAMVVLGSSIAAALMWRVGTLLGPADPATVAAHASGRTRISGNLTVAGRSPYLVWPMVSLFVLALVYFAVPASVARRDHHPGRSTDRREADAGDPQPR